MNTDELAAWTNGQKQPKDHFRVVMGIIAIVVTVSICIIAIKPLFATPAGKIEVPDFLIGTFTLIIGFFFGSKVGKSQSETKAEAA